MKITWVPSKKARDNGYVPADYKVYDIDTEVTPVPESSLQIMLTRSFRHMYNNEAASAWKAANEKSLALTPPVTLDKAVWLNDWRVNQRNKILEGKLGMREAAVVPMYDERTTEARSIVYTVVRKHIETASKGTIVLGDQSPANLAREYEGKTVEQWVVDLLDESKSKNAAAFWKKADENVAKRHAESDFDLSDIMPESDDDEEEDEADAAA